MVVRPLVAGGRQAVEHGRLGVLEILECQRADSGAFILKRFNFASTTASFVIADSFEKCASLWRFWGMDAGLERCVRAGMACNSIGVTISTVFRSPTNRRGIIGTLKG